MMRLHAMKGWRYRTGNCNGIVHPFPDAADLERKGSEVALSSPFSPHCDHDVSGGATQKKGV
jgi:hypothetical protein